MSRVVQRLLTERLQAKACLPTEDLVGNHQLKVSKASGTVNPAGYFFIHSVKGKNRSARDAAGLDSRWGDRQNSRSNNISGPRFKSSIFKGLRSVGRRDTRHFWNLPGLLLTPWRT